MSDLLKALDEAVKRMGTLNGQGGATGYAYSRFTKAPIHVRNVSQWVPKEGSRETVGAYYPRDRRITIGLKNEQPTWKDLASVINHETIHDALYQGGQGGKEPQHRPLNFKEMLTNILHAPELQSWQTWNRSSRAGTFNNEIPAYMGAYMPGELKGTSPEDRQRWLDSYLPTLPNDLQTLLRRIITTHDATMKLE
jgi:hypothetical protein